MNRFGRRLRLGSGRVRARAWVGWLLPLLLVATVVPAAVIGGPFSLTHVPQAHAATSNTAEDTFNRTTTAAGLGTTTNGDGLTNLAWSGDAASSANITIGVNRAILSYPGSTSTTKRGDLAVTASATGQVLAKVNFSHVGNSYVTLALAMNSGATQNYSVRLNSSTNQLILYRFNAGTYTSIGTAFSFTPASQSWYWIRLSVTQSAGVNTIGARIWAEGSAEPGSNQTSATDSSPLAAGFPGFEMHWKNVGTGETIQMEDFAYAPSGTASTDPSTIVYHTSGQAVVDNAGNTIPVQGVQIGELMFHNYTAQDSYTNLTQAFVQAMHDTWHASTIRLQLTNENLCAPGTTLFDATSAQGYCTSTATQPNSSYETVIKNVVAWAEAADLNVIFSYQGETDTRYTNRPLIPVADATHYWTELSTLFAGDTHVWFDIFNEPDDGTVYTTSNCPAGTSLTNCRYDCLVNGYNAADTILQYCIDPNGNGNGVGYNSLVSTIRAHNSAAVIVAEGLANGHDGRFVHYTSGTTLDYDDRLTEGTTQSGSNQIIYAIHEYAGGSWQTTSDFDTYFGTDYRTAGANGRAFVIVQDEFGVYDKSGNTECTDSWPGEPLGNPYSTTLFSYLATNGIGNVGFTMLPGHLINVTSGTEPWPVNSPTTETTGNFGCVYAGSGNQYGSGIYGSGTDNLNQDKTYNTIWP